MLKNISLGTYYPGNSLLHRLQARTKLLLLLWFAIFLSRANNNFWHFAPYIVLVALVFLGTALSGVSLHQMWQRMRLLVLLAMLGAIPTLFIGTEHSEPLYTIGPFNVSFTLVRWAIIIYG